MEREAFLYVKAKLLNSSFENRNNFGSGKVHFNLTGTDMNDPSAALQGARRVPEQMRQHRTVRFPPAGPRVAAANGGGDCVSKTTRITVHTYET